MSSTGYGFAQRRRAVYDRWLQENDGTCSEAALQSLRKGAVKAIEEVEEDDFRTVVIDSRPPVSPLRARDATRRDADARRRWHCCRGTVFVEMPWRIMIFVLFLALGDRASAVLELGQAFTVFFGPEVRELRKTIGLVWPHREHSFGFLQARAFVNEAMIEWGIYRNSGHRLPLVVFAQCLIDVGLLEERDGTLAFDGPLVKKVNGLYRKLADSKDGCRLTVEVFLLIVFNMTIGTPEIYQTVPRAIWSSCFWGSDSQSKAPLLTLLFESYARFTCDDARATALAERAFRAGDTVPEDVIDELNAIVSSAAFTETLDRGYPDADIKASRDANLAVLTPFSADLGRVWEFMGWA